MARLVVLLAAIGALTAATAWKTEHFTSALVALALVAAALSAIIALVWSVQRHVAELANANEMLRRAADEALQRAEVAGRTRDEFFATLSHELRTPLNSMMGWARLLGGGKLDAAQTQLAIDAINRGGRTQARIIDDLLDVSRLASGRLELKPSATSLEPLIEETVASLRCAAAAKDITLDLALDGRVGAVSVDPDRFRQIVWNLVSNAIKFTPRGGSVGVRWRADGDRMILTVRDTGVGFTPEVARHLFERFRQGDSSTTRPYGGLGLGLGIVRHLVELHGGTVSARSEGPGKGSVFAVLLPLRRDVPQRPAA